MGLLQIAGAFIKQGKQLEAPPAPFVDIAAEQEKAVKANISISDALKELSRQATEIAQQQGVSDIGTILGGGTMKQIQDQIQSALRGEIPPDVVQQIGRRAAEAGVRGGTAGSEFASNRTLRDLGLTSLQRIGQGLDAANRWLATAGSRFQQFDFASMFLTPAQAISQANINATNQFQRDLFQRQIDISNSTEWILAEQLDQLDRQILAAAAAYFTGQNFSSTIGPSGGGLAATGAGGGGVTSFGGVNNSNLGSTPSSLSGINTSGVPAFSSATGSFSSADASSVAGLSGALGGSGFGAGFSGGFGGF